MVVGSEGTVRLSAAHVKAEATAVGFDLCGIAAADSYPELLFLRTWLDRGYAGEMEYMHRTAERRADVRAVMPSARSVISLGVVYNTPRPYSTDHSDPARRDRRASATLDRAVE
jgi:epoxyqueuosine reductase